jgi:hypothetical protein
MAQWQSALNIVRQASLMVSAPALETNTATLFDPLSQTSLTWLNCLIQATNDIINYQTDRYFNTLIREQLLSDTEPLEETVGIYALPTDYYRPIFVRNLAGNEYQQISAAFFRGGSQAGSSNFSYSIANNELLLTPSQPRIILRYVSEAVYVPIGDTKLPIDFNQGDYVPSSDSDIIILPSQLVISAAAFMYGRQKGVQNLNEYRAMYMQNLNTALDIDNRVSPLITGSFSQAVNGAWGRSP